MLLNQKGTWSAPQHTVMQTCYMTLLWGDLMPIDHFSKHQNQVESATYGSITGFYPSPKSFWSCTHVNSCQKYALYINLHILVNISSKATSNTQESRKFIKSLKR